MSIIHCPRIVARTVVRLAALLVATCSTVCAAEPAEPSRFDGAWDVTIDCPSNTEPSNAKGYTYRFAATVTSGMMVGGRGDPGEAGSLHIEGPITADGSALLRANGRTNDPAYAVQHPTSGSPYRYRIKAQFDGSRGTGSRLEARDCTFVFVKR